MSLLYPDLTHADWWIRTCTKLLQKIDTSLRFTVVKVEKTQHLMVENISEATLSKLFFLVNTDQNNNYGYLEALQVFVKDDYSRTAIPIPGFSTLANAIWNEADAMGFVEGEKTQTAFLAPLNNPYTNEPLTIPEYVDWITAVIPWAPKTFGKEKIFTLMLNPDSEEFGIVLENLVKEGGLEDATTFRGPDSIAFDERPPSSLSDLPQLNLPRTFGAEAGPGKGFFRKNIGKILTGLGIGGTALGLGLNPPNQ
jgi:hypothetical protein